MLSIHYGDMDSIIYNTAVYFANTYEDYWLDDPFARRMVKSVDKANVISNRLIDTKVLGLVSPSELSGGLKTLLLVYNEPDKIFNASTCGDNCAPWLLRIGKKLDVTINLYHMMDFGEKPFEIRVTNDGSIVHSMEELVLVAGRFLGGGAS